MLFFEGITRMGAEEVFGWARLRQSLHRLRTEGDTPGRQAAAFGLGVFIGCTPAFGFHLPLCMLGGWLLSLNRLKMYVAANVSNPFVAPVLLFAEVQVGRLLRTGTAYALPIDTVRTLDLWAVAADLLVGSLVVGTLLGLAAGGGTYGLVRRYRATPVVSRLLTAAADRFVEAGMVAWEFANGKLRLDQVYCEVLRRGLLPDEGTLVDLGCGRGLMLSLLVSAADLWRSGRWPEQWPPPPTRLSLRGVELRPRIARQGRRALAGRAVVDAGDARTFDLPAVSAVLLYDVLHMLPFGEQDRLLARVAAALEPGGVLVVREADRAGGWRLRLVHIVNRVKGVLEGDLGRRFYFRSTSEWVARFEQLGFAVRTFDEHAPLANVLFDVRRPVEPAAWPPSNVETDLHMLSSPGEDPWESPPSSRLPRN